MQKKRTLFLFFLLLCFNIAKADHHLGGEIKVQALDSTHSTVEVLIVLDRFCNTSQYPQSINFSLLQSAGTANPKNYVKSIHSAQLISNEIIYLPCGIANGLCDNNMKIERNVYQAYAIITNPNEKAIVLYEGNYRIDANNLSNLQETFLLFNEFEPKYINNAAEISEKMKPFPILNQTERVAINSIDIDNDSLDISVYAPYRTANYTLTNFTFTPTLCPLIAGLSYNKPFIVSQSSIPINDNSYTFTPSQIQNSAFSYKIKEYRKVGNSQVCISTRNQENYLVVNNFSTSMTESIVSSNSSSVFVTSNDISICNDGNSIELSIKIPKNKLTKTNQIDAYWLNSKESITLDTNTIFGSAVDTLELTYTYIPKGSDFTDSIQIKLANCYQGSLGFVNFTRDFSFKFSEVNYRVFETDTILSCSSSAVIPIQLTSFNPSLGSISNNYINISSPHDTMIYAYLLHNNSNCPQIDSIYLDQGSIFSTQISINSPTCYQYNDGKAWLDITGSNPPYTFLWSTTETSDTIKNLKSGEYFLTTTDKDGCIQADTFTMTSPSGIQAIWTMDSTITCYGANNGKGHFEILSSIKPSLYTWTHTSSNDSFQNQLSEGHYSGTYQYLNALNNACTQNFSIYIPQPDSISFQVVKNDISCYNSNNGQIAIVGNGGSKPYTYYANAISQTNENIFSNLTVGNYQIKIIDRFGCTSYVENTSISSPDKLTTSFSITPSSCESSVNGKINIQAISGGTPQYKTAINGNNYTDIYQYSNLQSGNYILSIKDRYDCKLDTPITINSIYELDVDVKNIVDATCPNSDNGKAEVIVNTGFSPFTSYASNQTASYNTTNFEVTDLTSGLTNLTIKDKNNCLWDTTLTVTAPDSFVVEYTVKDLLCYNSSDGKVTINSVSGGTSPYQNIVWQKDGQPYDVSNGYEAGEYTYSFTDNKGCEHAELISVKNAPEFRVILTQLTSIFCQYDSNAKIKADLIGGTPPFKYQWNHNSLSNEILYNSGRPGENKVIVIDSNNCRAENITNVPKPFKFYVSNTITQNPTCPNSSDGKITIYTNKSTIEDMFSIDNGYTFSKSYQFDKLQKGVYTIVVKDVNNCRTTKSVILDDKHRLNLSMNPIVDTIDIGSSTTIPTKINFSPNTSMSDINSITWTPSQGLSCIECLNPIATPYSSSQYQIQVQYGEGCIDTASYYLDVNSVDDLYIPTAFSPNGDDKNDVWKVYGKNVKDISIVLLNRVGELVFKTNDINKGWAGDYRLGKENINSYVYNVKATFINGEQKEYKGILTLIK